MKRGEPENESPGCFAKSRMFRIFCFFMVVLVELLAGGAARECVKITLIFTENAKFPIKKGYLRVKKCYSFSH